MANKRIYDAFFSGMSQIWRFIAGPITMVLLPLYVTPEEQGIWYTFAGLAALSTFADLGFTNIILQFSAHEFSKHRFNTRGELESSSSLTKMSAIFHFIIRWTMKIGIAAFGVMFLIGLVLFKSKITTSNWYLPWLLFTAGSFIGYIGNSLLVFVEGCDKVGEVQKIKLFRGVVNTGLFWIALLSGASVLGLSIAVLLSSVFLILWSIKNYGRFFKQLFIIKIEKQHFVEIKKQFYSLFWRYAISFTAGYMIFQIYTPLVFTLYGPEIAGKVGLSLNIWLSGFNLANVWMQSSYSKYNILVAQKKWIDLDKLFKSNLLLTVLSFVLGTVFFLWVMNSFYDKIAIFQRMLNMKAQLFLILAWFATIFTNSIALYVRSHKIEPFTFPSVIQAVYGAIATFLCAKFLTIDYFFMGFFSSFIFVLPWFIGIWLRTRVKYHNINH